MTRKHTVLDILARNKQNIIYGLSLALLLFLLRWLEWQYMVVDHSAEMFAGVIAIIFTCLGCLAVMYYNPMFNALFTYMEILPVGLMLSIIAAMILKRRTVKDAAQS